MLEVGTHWAAAVLELMGYGSSVESSDCHLIYPDGPDGTQCESHCSGELTFSNGVKLRVEVDTQSGVAAAAGKDIYELDIFTAGSADRPFLTLYDFVKLRDATLGSDIPTSGKYGRQECVDAFVQAVEAGQPGRDVVTCQQAMQVQQVIESILHPHTRLDM